MWQTVGHDKAIRTLNRSLAAGRLAHSYLISGPSKIGKTTLALDIARAANCTSDDRPCRTCRQCYRISSGLHPDVRIVGLEASKSGRMRTLVSIEQVRDIQRDASLLPYEGQSRVFVIENGERLSGEAANSLLKLLEEPPDRVIIIIVTSDVDTVLPTIRSRCRRIDLRTTPPAVIATYLVEDKQLSRESAEEIAGLSGGRIGWAIEAANDPDIIARVSMVLDSIEVAVSSSLAERFEYAEKLSRRFSTDRQGVFAELELWQSWWHDVFLIGLGKQDLVVNSSRRETLSSVASQNSVEEISASLRAVRHTITLLERNVSPRLGLESMMLKLPMIS